MEVSKKRSGAIAPPKLFWLSSEKWSILKEFALNRSKFFHFREKSFFPRGLSIEMQTARHKRYLPCTNDGMIYHEYPVPLIMRVQAVSVHSCINLL